MNRTTGIAILLVASIVTVLVTAIYVRRQPASQQPGPSVKGPVLPAPTEAPEHAGSSSASEVSDPVFAEVEDAAMAQFRYFNDENLERMFGGETNGAGLGWLDFDGDGLVDLYVPNGCRLPYRPDSTEHVDGLFWNRGRDGFREIARLAGIAENGFGQGLAVADFDNDSWTDIFVCNFGACTLWRNAGDGTFRHIDQAPPDGWNAGAAFGDLDRDGDVDLYVTVYAIADVENVPVCRDSASGKVRVYCGPDSYSPTRHHLFLNDGSGGFIDATRATGCDKTAGKGMGVVIVDLDHDLWPEVFVANDMTPSYLYHNRTRQPGTAPRFEEIGVEAGLAFNGNGDLVAGMGIAAGDADGDGWIDLYVSHYMQQGNTFYRNRQNLSFTDDTAAWSLFLPSLPYLGFGTEFVDYDNDGWLDLYVINGHVLGPHYPLQKMTPQLYHNCAGKDFEEVTRRAGPFFREKRVGRGSAGADFDNDGAVDLAVLHLDRPLALLRNVALDRGNSIGLVLVGTLSNRDGINTEITTYAGARTLVRQAMGGGGYQSAPDYRLSIGLGSASKADRLDVVWSSGRRDSWTDLAAGAYYLLVEGRPPRLLSRFAER